MIKIELELPDWVEGKHIYIMAGIELAAYKHLNKPWKVKTGKCNMCGKCCEDITGKFPPSKEGTCIYLENDGKDKKRCSLAINRPFRCCIGTSNNVKECTEKYDTVL